LNPEKFLKILDKHGFAFIQNLNLYILQDHNYISKLFKDGEFQVDFLSYLKNVSKETIINLTPLRKSLSRSSTGREAELEAKQGDLLTSPYEFDLVKKLAEFNDTILRAKNELAPHLISRYLFELSTVVN
jgi:hypothetical protein